MKNVSVDIIIVNFNSTGYLLKCLKSIYANLGEVDVRVTVIENNSQNKIDPVVKTHPQVAIIQNPTNVGFAAAINQGIKKSSSKYLLFLNPDTYIAHDFFRPMIDYMETHPRTGILGPKILDTDNTIQGSARAFPNALTALYGRSSPLTKYFPNNPVSKANIMTIGHTDKEPMAVDWISGACMMTRRKAIAEVGLLDERFFMYWEDADLCRRMWRKGWKVIYFPDPSLHHHIGKSSDSRPLRSIYHFHRSSFLLFEKYVQGLGRALLPVAFFALMARGIMVGCWNILGRYVFAPNPRQASPQKDVSNHLRSDTVANLPLKIKIVRVISRINIGGPAIHVNLLQDALNKGNFDSTLVSGSLSRLEGDMSYIITTDPGHFLTIPEMQRELNPWKDLKSFLKLFIIIRKINPHIVHSHTAKAGSITRLSVVLYNLLYKRQIKTIHTFHGHVFEGYFSKLKSQFFIWTERILAGITDKIIAISPTQREEIVRKYHIAKIKKVETIELGFDLEPFLCNRELKGHFRKELGIDKNVWLVGIIGRLVPVKNHVMFLRAVAHFTRQFPDKKILFAVIGDGELRDDLENICIQQGIFEQVRFCGWKKDIQYIYADLDTLALTSINEGTPVSIIEAMASGVPVVSTDAGGIKDLLGEVNIADSTDGFKICKRGLLVQNNDEKSLANGIKYILDQHTSIHDRMTSDARRFIMANYQKDRLVRDIQSLYEKLLIH